MSRILVLLFLLSGCTVLHDQYTDCKIQPGIVAPPENSPLITSGITVNFDCSN